jgi:hypothetical protein
MRKYQKPTTPKKAQINQPDKTKPPKIKIQKSFKRKKL